MLLLMLTTIVPAHAAPAGHAAHAAHATHTVHAPGTPYAHAEYVDMHQARLMCAHTEAGMRTHAQS